MTEPYNAAGRGIEWVAATCDDPNPGSSYNAACRMVPDHFGDHDNGFSQWSRSAHETED